MDQKRENENLERQIRSSSKLLKVDISVAIRIDRSDHLEAIFNGAFHAQAVEDEVELGGGDEAVLVLIVELERAVELEGFAIFKARVAEGGELGQENEAIVVRIELIHDTAELVLVGEGGDEGAKDSAKLRQEPTHSKCSVEDNVNPDVANGNHRKLGIKLSILLLQME